MYKTVRHGENSLQYTILPQTEEVLSTSGVKGKGRDYSPSVHVKRTKRSTLKYVLLLAFGALVAFGLAAVPLYVMKGGMLGPPAVPVRRATPVLTYAGVTYDRADVTESRKKELRLDPIVVPWLTPEPIIVQTTASSALETEPPRSTPPLAPLWSSTGADLGVPTTVPIVEDSDELNIPNGPFSRSRASPDVAALTAWGDRDVIIRPTATPEPRTTAGAVYDYVTRVQAAVAASSAAPTTPPPPTPPPSERTTFEDVLITTTSAVPTATADPFEKTYPLGKDVKEVKESILDDDEEFKEVGVDDVPPPPRREPGAAGWVAYDEVKVTKASPRKYQNAWGFNPSSMFQWPEYSAEEYSLVVPLLALTVTLLAAALGLTITVAVRRHRQYTGGTHIGKLTADLQAEDNAKLLTGETEEE